MLPNHLLRGSLSSAQWSHICRAFIHIHAHTHTHTHTDCRDLLLQASAPRPHVWVVMFSYFCLFVSLSVSHIQEQLKSLQSGFKHVNEGGFQLQRWVYAHTHTHVQMRTHTYNKHNAQTEWAACSSCVPVKAHFPADVTQPSLFNYW